MADRGSIGGGRAPSAGDRRDPAPSGPAPVHEGPPPPRTRRSSRSLASRLAPLGVLLLGLVCVAVAVARLDGIYQANPGAAAAGHSNTWGTLEDRPKQRILALINMGGGPTVVTAPKRTAFAYRRVAENVTGSGTEPGLGDQPPSAATVRGLLRPRVRT